VDEIRTGNANTNFAYYIVDQATSSHQICHEVSSTGNFSIFVLTA